MENNKKSLKETGRTVAKYVVGGLFTFLALMVIISALTGQTKAQDDKKTLQESVEMAQTDYDLSQSQALDAMKSYCKNWVELGNAKALLAETLKIKANQPILDIKVCESITVPTSF